MINPLIISRLIEANYRIFLPVDGDNQFILAQEGSEGQAFLQLCYASNASQDNEKSPIFRCPPEPLLSAVCDATTRTVWLIPTAQMQEKVVIRLGKLYEEFILPEPTSRSYLEQKEIRKDRAFALRQQAFNVGKEHGNVQNQNREPKP